MSKRSYIYRNKKSIVTLVDKNINQHVIERKVIIEGRVLSIKMKVGRRTVEIWNIYGPAAENERLDFLKKLFQNTQDMGNLIMGGDFNIITSKEETSGELTRKPYMSFYEARTKRQNFKDAHITLNRGKISYTFTASNNKTRKRLDKFLYKANLQNRILDYYIKPNIFSDHEGIVIKIDLGMRKKWGKGVWKMNNEVLQEDKYREYMTEVISEFKERKFTENLEPDEWWDKLKAKIKKETVIYCRDRGKNRTREKRVLEKKMEELQGNIDQNLDKGKNLEKLTETKLKLNRISESELRGARIRAKVEEIENDEKSTRYFFSKEQINGEKKQIRTLLKGNELIEGEEEIIRETDFFYSKLYKSEGVDNEAIKKMRKNIGARLNQEDSEKLNILSRTLSRDYYAAF